MTQYEKALVLGKRATQISAGAKPNITVKVGMTVVEIATEELRQQKVPFILKRPIGNRFEYWKIKDLIVNLE
jgi:DNA-directed RNA polymerase subunit K/omega